MGKLIRIAPDDDVGVAVSLVASGEVLLGVEAKEAIPEGHKMALRPISRGEMVRKHAYPIGIASRSIREGEHVHVHNLASDLSERVEDLDPDRRSGTAGPGCSVATDLTRFAGFVRADGGVGTRNEIWIVPTVGCVAGTAHRIAEEVQREGLPSGIDGVFALGHGAGCSQIGADLAETRSVLAGLVRHPNAAGVLVLGLGCESNGIADFLRVVGSRDPERLSFFDAQAVEDEVAEGLARVRELTRHAAGAHRQAVPVSRLIVGLKCGGSDGLSGLTANPLVGRVARRLAEEGATLLLSEVPEMFGAETALLERCVSPEVRRAALRLVNGFRANLRHRGAPIDENPSPGNRAGGLTTLAEKSLGCIQKGGMAPVVGVSSYGEVADAGRGGVILVEAPGNDAISTTALVAAGAQIVLFTTGRGTPLGSPVPTLKISSSSSLARQKPRWIDFDAGVLGSEAADADEVSDRLLDLVLDVVGGTRRCRNEEAGFRDVALWRRGVTL